MRKAAVATDETYQLPLFADLDVVVPAKGNSKLVPTLMVGSRLESLGGVEWSYSRRTTLNQCARRFYNEYYGANKRTAKSEPKKEKLHLLKALQSRHECIGQIAHKAIATYLRKSQSGERWEADRLYGFAQMILNADLEHSRAYLTTGTLPVVATRYPPVLLREFYYNQPDAEELYIEMTERMRTGLRAFVTSATFNSVRLAGSMPGANIEQHFKLTDFPCKVTGQVDLAYWDGDTFVIVDWKLNSASGTGDDSLQLAVYALWAMQVIGCDPSKVRVYKAHLLSEDLVEFQIDATLLADARARILQDAELMAEMQEFAKAGRAEAFTPCEQPDVCASCSFWEDCYGC